MDVAATMKLFDALRPRTQGELVNAHVIRQKREVGPDIEAMRKLIGGTDDKQRVEQPPRAIPENR